MNNKINENSQFIVKKTKTTNTKTQSQGNSMNQKTKGQRASMRVFAGPGVS